MADNIFVKLSRQLFPTGRAWWIRKDGVFEQLLQGLSLSEQEVLDTAKTLMYSILPDNDDFTADDATNWERALGLFYQPYLSLADRKEIILRKMQHPGNIPARQHYLYLQGQLRAAGFDVYVHENIDTSGFSTVILNNPVFSNYGIVKYGEALYGHVGISGMTKVVNNTVQEKDDSFIVGDDTNMRATFFVGDSTFPDFAGVPLNRRKEFRELILKIKPAQTVGFLLINYTL